MNHPRSPPQPAGAGSPSSYYSSSQSPSSRNSPPNLRATSPLSPHARATSPFSPNASSAQVFRSASPSFSATDYRRSPTPRNASPHPRAISPLPTNLEIAIPPGAQLPPERPAMAALHERSQSSGQVHQLRHHQSDSSLALPQPAYAAGNIPRAQSPAFGSPPTESRARSMSASSRLPPASTPSELAGLWDASQGIITEEKAADNNIFILNMYRQAPLSKPQVIEHPLNFPEHFTFGTNPQSPFYSIKALPESPYDTNYNELLVTRRHPSTGQDASMVTMALEPPSRRISPGGDGLVTLIYPKLAVLHAMEASAATRSETETWSSKDPGSLVKDAVRQAEKECCRLVWSKEKGRYYLYHPGVSDAGNVYLLDIEGEVGFDNLSSKGKIKLINVDTNELMTAVDFSRNLLFINTTATSRIPSRYIIDVAVATVLAVATVEGRRIRTYRRSLSQNSKREQEEYQRPPCFSPWEMIVGVAKGALWLVWFTARLGMEILKAIFDVFRKD
ncbi:hypothetical protein RUND412_004699 [Rhizina undulata]